MSEKQFNRLVKIYMPAALAVVVLISTIYRHLTTPIPSSVSLASFLTYDILVVLLLAPLLYHCLKTMGLQQGLLFFFTVSVFVGGLEALWVFLGKLGILGDAYDYAMGGLWFFGVPFYIALGWFLWVYVFYFLAKQTFPKAGRLKIACLCGLMALCIDIWMDPAVVNLSRASGATNIWEWAETGAPVIFTVPLYNFVGWFLTAAAVVIGYEISWARVKTFLQSGSLLRKVFTRLVAVWGIFVVVTKVIQVSLDQLPNINLWPLVFERGGHLPATKLALLILFPALLVTCLVVAVLRGLREKASRKDIWLTLGFTAALAINFQMVYTLQLTFPGIFLIYLVIPGLLPLGLLLHYLLRPVSVSLASDVG